MIRLTHLCIFLMVLLSHGIMGLSTDESSRSNSYYGAFVQFQYKDSHVGSTVTLGSTDPLDEVGRYGFHSPIKNISGQIVYAVTSNDIRDGCKFNYGSVHLPSPWLALVSRGNCTFAEKIDNAAKWNASGIIVYDLEKNTNLETMSHADSTKIVSVMIKYGLGISVGNLAQQGTKVNCFVEAGKEYPETSGFQLERTSIIFVSVSFMILMLVSLAWLIFYYIQRLRILQAHNRGMRHRNRLAQRAVMQLKTRTIKPNDEIVSTESVCAICIENYKTAEVVRELPCRHIFHKKCVDPWLHTKHTCPMCKINIIKTTGNCEDNDSGHFNDGALVSVNSVNQDMEMEAIIATEPSPPASTTTTDDEQAQSTSNFTEPKTSEQQQEHLAV
uniref:RING finger protein 150 n=1 Tax=Ciona intestinalis TaxID=7719 RepID=UPI00006A45F3|nr:RING finger protein 150 [Ciona intestinalis]|eukprot:XP_002124964.1 RING finger protein 150 [Ciona intestinalis]